MQTIQNKTNETNQTSVSLHYHLHFEG